jgi:hypothetical protein
MLKLPTIFLLITFSFLAVIHIIALELFLYWRFWWFDIPVHFIGGIVVALGVFTLHDLRIVIPTRLLQLVPVLLLVILVAMVWEVYEVLIGIPIESDAVLDVLTDLSMGILGGLVGYTIGTNLNKL